MATERQVVRHGPFAEFIADGVKVGNMIYLSGQVSIDDQGQVVAPGDIVAQSRQAYAHIRSTLEEFGATMADIIDETVFVTDVSAVMANLETLFAARAEAYGGQPQVSQTLVQAAALFMPELMIEIKCVAAL